MQILKLVLGDKILSLLPEYTKDAVVVVNSDGRIVYWNKSAEEMFGFSKSEALGRKIWELIVPKEFIEPKVKGFRKFKETGEGPLIGKTIELEAIRKNGERFPIELSLSAFYYRGEYYAVATIRDITEKVKLREELKSAKDMYEFIVGNILDPIFVVGVDGKVKFISPNVKISFGYEPNEVVGRHILDFVHPDDKHLILEKFTKFSETQPFFLECRFLAKDGSIRYCQTTSRPVYEDGKLIAFAGTIRDLTERKLIEKKLREVEKIHRLVLENILDAVFMLDEKGIIRYISPGVKNFGYEVEDVLGKRLLDFIHPEDRKTLEEVFWKRFEGFGEIFEYRIVAKDGSVRYCQSVSSPIYKNKKVFGVVGVIRDITDRKRIENELREREELFRTLTEGSPTGVYLIKKGKFIYVNPTMERITGCSRKELLQVDPFELIHPDYRDMVEERHFRREAGEEVPERYEFKIITKNGERWVDLTAKRVKIGGEYAILGNFFDVTSKKEAEEKLKKFNRLLVAIGEINQLIVRGISTRRLLSRTCKILSDTGNFPTVLICTLDRTLQPVAMSTRVKLYQVREKVRNCEVIKLALDSRKHVLNDCKRMECEECWIPEDVGRKVVLAAPLCYKRRVYGAIALVADTFEEEEVQYILDVARNLGLALRHLEVTREKERAFEQIKKNLEQFEMLADKLRNPLAIMKGFIELKSQLDHGKIFSELENQISRIEEYLDQLSTEELRTIELEKLFKRF
ncbi:hypothetical protein DRN63_04050 [Nanoarchaeota archaeon]|nr:MAG: hypothetical protein DRN63_04050 [Nanoarchaeota archaeon]